MIKPVYFIIIIFSALTIAGCSSNKGEDKAADKSFNAKIIKSLAWYNLMPSTEPVENLFYFSHEGIITGKNFYEKSAKKFEVRNFKIYLDNEQIDNKKISAEFTITSDDTVNFVIHNDFGTNYYSNSENMPVNAGFEFSLYLNNALIKEINIKKSPIKKVY